VWEVINKKRRRKMEVNREIEIPCGIGTDISKSY